MARWLGPADAQLCRLLRSLLEGVLRQGGRCLHLSTGPQRLRNLLMPRSAPPCRCALVAPGRRSWNASHMSSLPWTFAEDVIDQPARAQFEVFLNEHRVALNGCLDGLTEEQVRRSLVPSRTTLLGLVDRKSTRLNSSHRCISYA